jgi:hypothetical protein
MAGVLFEDIFDVKDIDPDGKKFDRGKVYIHHVFHLIFGIPTRIDFYQNVFNPICRQMTIQDGDCRVNVTFLLILMMFGHRPR